jgi:thioredoxin reductase
MSFCQAAREQYPRPYPRPQWEGLSADCGADAAVPFNVSQTNLPGVFAVGDVSSGSVKRVASAVGEESVVVQAIQSRLASLRPAEARGPVTT